jgi:hypothetical protein
LISQESFAIAVVQLRSLAQQSRVNLLVDLFNEQKVKVCSVKLESEWFPNAKT